MSSAVSDPKDAIDQLRKEILQDRASPHQRLPDQSLQALDDERVALGIRSRLERGARLTGIHPLEYNFPTGLNHLYFAFTAAEGISITADAILVILDSQSRVVGVVDPFDPAQPNRLLPPLPEQPFVLACHTVSDDLYFTKEELRTRNAADSEFFRKLELTNKPTKRMMKQEWDWEGAGGAPWGYPTGWISTSSYPIEICRGTGENERCIVRMQTIYDDCLPP